MYTTLCHGLQEVKYHPSSVDLELVKRLATITNCSTLLQFLIKEFSCIPKALAGAHVPRPACSRHVCTGRRWPCSVHAFRAPSSVVRFIWFLAHAERLIDELRSGATPKMHPMELDTKQLTR